MQQIAAQLLSITLIMSRGSLRMPVRDDVFRDLEYKYVMFLHVELRDWDTCMSVLAHLLLSASLVSLWVVHKTKVWLSLFAGAVIFGFLGRCLEPLGIGWIVVFSALCFGFYRMKLNFWLHAALGWALLGFSILFGSHLTSGFNNWRITSNFYLSRDAIPVTTYLNFDKPLIGLFLIGFGHQTVRTWDEWRDLFRKIAPLLFCTCSVLLSLSYAFHYVRWDVKWVEFSGLWLMINLLYTCVAEEAFFRGFLQKYLMSALRKSRGYQIFALLIASFNFGLAHFKGGWTYVILASIAGLFYGLAYWKTKRIEASILIHFSVNAIHFVCFTFPALSPR